jgi:hypothetical protein
VLKRRIFVCFVFVKLFAFCFFGGSMEVDFAIDSV